MHHIKVRPHVVLYLKKGVDERAAHILNLFDEIRVCAERNPVIVNAMNTLIEWVIMAPHTGKHMDLVPLSF
jgi:hypothetical protein